MARKYSSWALSNDFNRMKLTTVNGNEQDQLKQFDRVEAIPHMYINVDAPPAPISSAPISIIRTDSHAFQPKLNASFVSVSNSTGGPAKLWPADRSSVIDSASSSSKRRHKHHHHHHHHHGDKHHHHHRRRHHSRHHRAKSAESIRNRVQPTFLPVESQPQQMVVYREGYPTESNPTSLATVPYMTNEQETSYIDDQQAPMVVYRDTPSIIQSDGSAQPYFIHPEQETKHLQTIENKVVSHHVTPCAQTQVAASPSCLCVPTAAAPSYIEEIERYYLEDDCCPVPSAPIQHSCIVQQAEPPSQYVYCTEPAVQHHQEYLCNSPSSVIQSQPQFICMDNLQSVAQPTMINQIPVFNTATTAPSLQRTTSVVLPQQVIQSTPAPAQFIQVSSPTSPQVIQAVPAPMIQMPLQTVAAAPSLMTSPQILYQRPYDQMVVPVQSPTVALAANPQPVFALSQPSYAPARLATMTTAPAATANNPGPNMFRHALLRTVADRAGVPVPTANVIAAPTTAGNLQLVQGAPNLQAPSSSSLPIVPLTPGGLLIPFQPNLNAGRRSGPFPRLGGYSSSLKNFQDIRQQIDQRAQILSQMPSANRAPSPPVLSTGSVGRTAYQGPPSTTGSLLSPANSGPYGRTGVNYSPPSLAGSITSGQTNPYRIVRP